jgi:hypothetical protein
MRLAEKIGLERVKAKEEGKDYDMIYLLTAIG